MNSPGFRPVALNSSAYLPRVRKGVADGGDAAPPGHGFEVPDWLPYVFLAAAVLAAVLMPIWLATLPHLPGEEDEVSRLQFEKIKGGYPTRAVAEVRASRRARSAAPPSAATPLRGPACSNPSKASISRGATSTPRGARWALRRPTVSWSSSRTSSATTATRHID